MDEHGSPMIIVSESCRTHLRRGRRPSSLWYHRVRESFTRFSSVETRLTFVAVFVSRSRIAHPCKKKKKKSWTHEFYECCSHRIAATNSQQLKLSASIEQWPELAIISSHTPPPIFYFPLFVSFVYKGNGMRVKEGRS